MQSQAVARFVRVSPRKARLVIDLIRGKRVEEALTLLHFNKKAVAVPIEKTLRSAVANLMDKFEGDDPVSPESFVVSEAFVDPGATMKRFRPRSMGRATPILKRTSHITIRVSDGLGRSTSPQEK
jgi:large subunit ribosomal protein L22